jgi:hypothetical protein
MNGSAEDRRCARGLLTLFVLSGGDHLCRRILDLFEHQEWPGLRRMDKGLEQHEYLARWHVDIEVDGIPIEAMRGETSLSIAF